MKYFDDATIDKIRRGYYSAVYFNRTKEILMGEKNLKIATMQVFQRNGGSVLCGVEEVRELLEFCTGYFSSNSKSEILNPKQIQNSKSEFNKQIWIDKSDELKIESLKDGDIIKAGEPVMHITGPYAYFAHLESVYLGILARRTLVATNVHKCKVAAGKKPFGSAQGKSVIFFADRFDYFSNQEGDGYAAHIGGADGVCTEGHAKWWGGEPSGTIPHALIAIFGGDTVKATELFAKYYGRENTRDRNFLAPQFATDITDQKLSTGSKDSQVSNLVEQSSECDLRKFPSLRLNNSYNHTGQNSECDLRNSQSLRNFNPSLAPPIIRKNINVIALVDFHNDCVKTSLEVAKALGRKLWGVRIDTSSDLYDKSLELPVSSCLLPEKGKFYGVNPQLVKNVRMALDENGFGWVKIVVSGGFDSEKIKRFEDEKTPVDAYGVGSAMLKGGNDFTADIVKVEGKPVAKKGRGFRKLEALRFGG